MQPHDGPPEFSAQLVLSAYCAGLFPMAGTSDRIEWFSPDPRGVFEIETFRPARSLRQTIHRRVFETRVDTAFAEVLRACADRDEGTWISHQIFDVYCELHAAGYAHSVESWRDGRLVGGLYGVAVGAAFFGESMFHRDTDASKVALAALVERMKLRHYSLLDVQWLTPHLASLGAVEISRSEYLRRLRRAITRTSVGFGD